MTLDEAINKEEALAYSFGERYKRLGEPVGDLQELEAEHRQLAEWLRELKELRKFAHYVANSITAEEEEFDENPKFFGEVYCRKLHKLGIVKMVDNKWVYDEEVKDSEKDN